MKAIEPNFMMLDCIRTMNKLKAETLEPSLRSALRKDDPIAFYKEQKEKVFSSGI